MAGGISKSLVVLVVLAAVGVTAVTVGAVAGADGAADAEQSVTQLETDNGTNNTTVPLGSQISAFMQATAAETDADVDDGMWTAAFDEIGRASCMERAYTKV